jgi:hypothetical protein
MSGKFKTRDKSIAEQVSCMRSKYPHFVTDFTSHSCMKVTGVLQPTSRSVAYEFVLKYNLTDRPKTKIISPALQKNSKGEDVPHLYPFENLCLYQPKYCEFNRTDFLCDTIIPWTSLWLYYYEVWHLTDEWLGGGEHPVNTKPKDK